MSEFVIENGVLKEYTGTGINVIIPNEVTKIEPWAFSKSFHATKIENISVALGNKVYHSVDNCVIDTENKKLVVAAQNCKIPADGSITCIGRNAFLPWYDPIEEFVIPNTVTCMEDMALSGCQHINIIIPESVIRMGDRGISGGMRFEYFDCGLRYCKNLKRLEYMCHLPLLNYLVYGMGGKENIARLEDGFFPYEDFAELKPDCKAYALKCFLRHYERYPEEQQQIYIKYVSKQGSKKLAEYAKLNDLALVRGLLTFCSPNMECVDKAMEDASKSIEVMAFLLEYKQSHFDIEKEMKNIEKKMEKDLLHPKAPPKGPKSWLVRYDEDDHTRYGIYAYQGEEENVVVPSKQENKDVKIISKHAFSPNAADCKNYDFRKSIMKSVEISEGIEVIGKRAFWDCQALETVVLPESIHTIMLGAFSGCTSLQSIVIPENVKRLTNYDFADCTLLTSITIPSKVKQIGENTFDGCPNLTIFAPEGSYAEKFANDKNIKFQAVGTPISDKALSELTSIERQAAILSYLQNPDAYHEQKRLECDTYIQKQGSKLLKKFILEGNTEYINLLLIKYHPTMEITGSSLLLAQENSEITAILLAYQNSHFDMQKELDKKAKSQEKAIERGVPDVSELKKIWTIGLDRDSSVSGECCLKKYKGNDKCVVVPNMIGAKKVTSLEECFKGQDIQFVEIPEGVEGIFGAFKNCSKLKKVILPQSLNEIGDDTFLNCCSLEEVVIPDDLTSIGCGAFEGCSSLAGITIPNGVTSIGWRSFYNCTSLKSITISNSVKEIGYSAFNGCSSLTSIMIPKGVQIISDGVFDGCTSLTSITIPQSVETIENDVFKNCNSINSVYIDNISAWCNTVYGYPYSHPLQYGANLYLEGKLVTDIIIPERVECIGNEVFSGCLSLTSVTISNGIENIDSYAFKGCSNLTSITIPESVESIGYGAFMDCSSLENVTIQNGIESIDDYAFYDCSSLTSIIIPDDVESIGYCAFCGCSSLTSVTIPDSIQSIDDLAFDNCNEDLNIYGNTGSYAEKYASENNIKFQAI